MYFRAALAILVTATTLKTCAAVPAAVTLTLPTNISDEDEPVSYSQGGAVDGRTTYVVNAITPTNSAALSTFTPFAGTLVAGPSDMVVAVSGSGGLVATQSCSWGADSLATCVFVMPASVFEPTETGPITFTLESESVRPTVISVADPATTTSSSSSSTALVTTSPTPGSSTNSSGGPAPTGSGNDSGVLKTGVAWSSMVAAAMIGMMLAA